MMPKLAQNIKVASNVLIDRNGKKMVKTQKCFTEQNEQKWQMSKKAKITYKWQMSTV